MSKALVQRPAPGFQVRHPLPSEEVVGRLTTCAAQATVVVDGFFETVTLEQYKGKWVVLFFYPSDFTFVCPVRPAPLLLATLEES